MSKGSEFETCPVRFPCIFRQNTYTVTLTTPLSRKANKYNQEIVGVQPDLRWTGIPSTSKKKYSQSIHTKETGCKPLARPISFLADFALSYTCILRYLQCQSLCVERIPGPICLRDAICLCVEGLLWIPMTLLESTEKESIARRERIR